jgi:uncharacterized membrane protein
MVVRETDASGEAHHFILLPNRSMSWPAMRNLFLALFTCLIGVTVYFGLQGAWLVLPFAGLEALVLGVGIYLSAKATATRELVSITGAEVCVGHGRRKLAEAARFSRCWSRVVLQKDPRGWYPSRLLIGSHGRYLEIAKSLVEAEREQLALELRELIDQRSGFPSRPQPEFDPALETVGQQI